MDSQACVSQAGLCCPAAEKVKPTDNHQSQRCSKRLVTLLSSSSGGGDEDQQRDHSPVASGPCPKVLRSHTRRANKNINNKNAPSEDVNSQKVVAVATPTAKRSGSTKNCPTLSPSSQPRQSDREDLYQGNSGNVSRNDDEQYELLSSGSTTDKQGDRIIKKRGGGSEWATLRGQHTSSSSCSSSTNETKELCEQAGLGGTTNAKTALASTSVTTTRRRRRTSSATTASGVRRRSKRGTSEHHCLASRPLDAATTTTATQSTCCERKTTTATTIIRVNSSNNSSDSSQIMSSGDGEQEKIVTGSNSPEESCDDEKEMCQEDESSSVARGNCSALPVQSSKTGPSLISKASLPKPSTALQGDFTRPLTKSGKIIAEEDDDENEATEESYDREIKAGTICNIKSEESDSEQNYVGELFSKGTDKKCESSGGSRSHSKRNESKQGKDNTNQRKVGSAHNNNNCQISINKWKVDSEYQDDGQHRNSSKRDDRQAEPSMLSPSLYANVSNMPLLGSGGGDAGKQGVRGACAATPPPLPSLPQPNSSSSMIKTDSLASTTRNCKKVTAGQKNKSAATTSSSFSVYSNKSSEFSKCSGVETQRKVFSEKKKAGAQQKQQQAPMLLMNNLPYMGELTFDTRPRRGRKPKKADICHLISKNYGIQFPVSFVSIDDVGGGGGSTLLPNQTLSPSIPSSASQNSTKPSKRNTASSSSSLCSSISVLGGNTTVSSAIAPAPVPAFCNKDVSIVPIIPSPWNNPRSVEKTVQSTQSSVSLKSLVKPLSLAQQLMLCPSVTIPSRQGRSQQQTISMVPLNVSDSSTPFHLKQQQLSLCKSEEEDEEDEDDDLGESLERCQQQMDTSDDDETTEKKESQESPLNLCMRDSNSRFEFSPSLLAAPNQPLSLCLMRKSEQNSLDVRWKNKRESSKGNDRAQFGLKNSQGATTGANANKRNIVVGIRGDDSNAHRKVSKSAKMSSGAASQAISSSNVNDNSSCGSNSSYTSLGQHNVNVLVSQGRVDGLLSSPLFSSSSSDGRGTFTVTPTPPAGSGKTGKQSSSRRKKDVNLRGDVNVSSCIPPGSSGSTSGGGNLSSFGGTLFGQSTSGINDGAEVSICKFKFTGGAKPCLQEKKMLSVDSGGNFRFYTDKSGSGSSSSKFGKTQQHLTSSSSATSTSINAISGVGGRDTNLNINSSDATGNQDCHFALSSLPKSAKSMSICMPYAGTNSSTQVTNSTSYANQTKKASTSTSSSSPSGIHQIGASSLLGSSGSSAHLQVPSLPISPTAEELQQLHLSMDGGTNSPYLSGEFSSSNSCSSSDNSSENVMMQDGSNSRDAGMGMEYMKSNRLSGSHHSSSSHHHRHGSGGKLKRKRRTRKSMMREKLEKTFKEKGFLIQTQQLESAEGATYCKFRQLRKFTRYLFRSWKDYLPDHVKEISDKTNNGNNAPGTSMSQPMSVPPSYPSKSSETKNGSDEEEKEDNDEDMDDNIDLDVNDDEDLISHIKREAKGDDNHGFDDKDKESGGSDNDDDEVEEEKRVVLIEASRAIKSQQPNKSSALTTISRNKLQIKNHIGDNNNDNIEEDEEMEDDDEDEELQVDS